MMNTAFLTCALEFRLFWKNGIEKIIELDLDDSEYEHLKQSAESVKKTNSLLD